MESKSILVGFILGIVIAGSLAGYLLMDRSQFLNQIEDLKNLLAERENELSFLRDKISNLEDQVGELQLDAESLTTENNRLGGKIIELQTEVSTLQNQKRNIERNLTSLQSSYQQILLHYNSLDLAYQLEKELRIGNSLESYYDSLREGLGPTGAQFWWLNPLKHFWQTEVEFACDLAQHDLKRIYWPAYETDYEELIGENSYETAWNKLTTIVSYINISRYDSSTEKISQILSFLNENVNYEIEVNNIFLAPVETLGYKSGDCDDYSILTAALFEYVGIDSAIGFFKNDKNEYPAMVLVHLDDLEGYGYWYYDDLANLGLDEGQWIKIEPQTTIEYQDDDDWMGQWNILVAVQLED